MFLVYSGVFRDNTDPLQVTRYFIECLRNREYFLLNQIRSPESFDEENAYEETKEIYKEKLANSPNMENKKKLEKEISKYRFYLIKEIQYDLLDITDKNAFVQVKIIYKDKRINYDFVELEKSEKKWLIKGL